MIETVTKQYDPILNDFMNYRVVYSDGSYFDVPHSEDNRHYQEILEWVAEGNTITDNGGGD